MKNIYAAFIKAQKEFAPALKTSTNPHFKSRYAALDAVIEAVIDALNNNGIGLIQKCHQVDSGVLVETLFVHESGEQLEGGKLHVPADKQNPQGYGSALTYARRYCLMAACGIAPEDDDGQAASTPKPAAKQVKKEEPKPEIVVPDGMSILEFAEQMLKASETLEELQAMFKQLYVKTKGAPNEQTIITNLYNERKAELSK